MNRSRVWTRTILLLLSASVWACPLARSPLVTRRMIMAMAMTYTAMAGSVAGVITIAIMITTGIMVGGATALRTGTRDSASMAASPRMAAEVSMAASAGM